MRVSAILLILLVGCGAAAPRGHQTTIQSAIVSPENARIGDRTWCIVSGEEFTVTAASPKVEHGGKTYYFCCAGCDTDFAAAPEKYIGRPRPST
jgi:YHS domain-containing protein